VYLSVPAERDDVRLADAHRFMAEVQRLAPTSGPPFRIAGPDRTGTAVAVVDPLGRFVDVGLHPGWWVALGPDRVAAGLIEAVATARLKAALVPMILRRPGTDDGFLDAARGRIAEAARLIDQAGPRPAIRMITGPRGLFRLYLSGDRIDRAELLDPDRLAPGDTDALVTDARQTLRNG